MTDQTPSEMWTDAKGRLVPQDMVSDVDKLKTETVNTVFKYAQELSEQIRRFRSHTFDDVYFAVEMIIKNYGGKIGGKKGGVTLTSFDGLRKVEISMADHISFGPELVAAKALIDECIEGWSEGASDEIRTLVTHAFETDKVGKVNREGLFSLRRLAITDPKWVRAMEAIGDSMHVTGSKAYVRIHQRESTEHGWQIVPLNIAAME